MSRRSPTHYETLGVSRHATTTEIRIAYRAAARRAHPDAGGSAATMQTINDAWHVLGDSARRAAYDRELYGAPQAPPDPSGQNEPVVRSDEWDDVVEDLLDDHPIGAVRAPEGWWAIAPSATLVLAIGLFLGAVVFGSSAMAVFSGGMLFLALALFVLAPLRAMTRPK
jgi:hypothetical protein